MQKTANEIEVKQSHHQKVTMSMQQAKAQLVRARLLAHCKSLTINLQDELTQAREAHHPERESKIKELEAIIAEHKNSK